MLVRVDVFVLVGLLEGVNVSVGVWVIVDVFVCEGVNVRVGVWVGEPVFVGVGVRVEVPVAVYVGVGCASMSTSQLFPKCTARPKELL